MNIYILIKYNKVYKMNKTTTVRPQSANVNRIGRKVLNSYGQLNRENILKSFPQSTINQAWNSLCQFVAQNYYAGKGTTIKGLGTFTFSNADVSLEGTTNQYSRDHRKRVPVFLVSKEFDEHLRPGQYTKTSGVIYYNQKLSNSVGHVRFNYAEIAYGMNLSKEEVTMILQNEIQYMADSVRKGEFKNKEMPGVGTLMLRGNVLAVKFNSDLEESAKTIPQKLSQYKKNMLMYMEPEENKKISIRDLPDVAKTLKQLRPKTAVVTKISQNGEQWLKDNLGINLDEIDDIAPDNAENNECASERSELAFINDKPKIMKKTSKLTLRDLNIPSKVLEAILFHKSFIISEMKSFDRRNNGTIQRIECVRAFAKANAHYSLTSQMISEIVKVYANNVEMVDYMKLMTCLLRDIKNIIGVSSTRNSEVMTKAKSLRPMSASMMTPKEKNEAMLRTKVELGQVEKEVKGIKIILPDLIYKHRTTLDQMISLDELVKILREYSIAYPKFKIQQILNFIEIQNINAFSLNDFNRQMNNCKILSSEMTSEDILETFKKIKDIVYVSGGESFLFPDPSNKKISKEQFIDLFIPKTKFSYGALSSVYHFIVKSTRDMTIQDYNKFFVTDKATYDEEFDIAAMNAINKVIQRSQLKPSEYFSHMLSYNASRNANAVPRTDFHKIFLIEKMKYSAEEVDHIFNVIDSKGDGVIDREEFVKAVTKVYRPLSQIQDIIKRNRLDIEDICFRIEIDMNRNEVLDYIAFKGKMKKLDYTFSDAFITDLFHDINNGEDYVDTQSIISAFDVFKKEHFRNTNNATFTKNFIENIKTVATYDKLKKSFEHIDSMNNGRLSKADFCSIIQKYSNEFKDEDIMKFTRITQLVDSNNRVKYPEFLNMIYYNADNDVFTKCVEALGRYIKSECDGKLIKFFQKMNKSENRSVYDTKKTITLSQLMSFLQNRIGSVDSNVVCKFDLDSDGLISYDDITGVVERYLSTSFFKFENNSLSPTTNLYANDTMTEEKFKSIVKDIKIKMKKKNITEVGLFKKLDINGDGFVSNYEFNTRIDDVILLSPAIKDQFFNYLDYYHNGLVDMDTFLKRFKEYKSNDVLVRNNNKIENEIIDAFCLWVKKNYTTLSDTEMFELIDSDGDGIVELKDFKKFCISQLGFSSVDMNDYKLQRVMQSISLTKNNNIGIGDIKEMVNKATKDTDFVDFKEKFKETINQNLSKSKENVEWIHDVIEKFGMFISERYPSVDEFFDENTVKNSGKFTIEDFERFHRRNYECFEGFNLTRDEILAVFTTLDSQKKNYLTLSDFENKLKMFDFYKKMHFDIKNFINQNFNNAIDAFKFFATNENHNRDITEESYSYTNLTKKDFFDTINKFFPNKYLTDTILKYMTKYFKSPLSIPFSEFNFIYFDGVAYDDTYIKSKKLNSKLATTRGRPKSASSRTIPPNQKLQTPYDYDALTKLKRIIDSSQFDYSSYFSMYKSLTDNGYINLYEFRNMIKKLNIGMTHLEIEDIINKVGMTRDGKINFNEFLKFILSKDKNVVTSSKNMTGFISDMKELIYKYYSTPQLAFQFNDKDKSKDLDFAEYKAMVCELYTKESRQQPNFALLKNSFDVLDLRKDGVIDINEWNKAFSKIPSKLDVKGSEKQMKVLREWEGSNDIQKIYAEITKNRKLLREYIKPFAIIGSGKTMVQCDNLISVLKQVLPRTRLSMTQWRMMALMGDKERSGMVDFDLFMKIIEGSAKQFIGQPKFK